jgi:hypothetical protein
MYKDNQMGIDTSLFNFHNHSNPKHPENVDARYCFYEEMVEIPETDAKMVVDKGYWIIIDKDLNLTLLSMDQFKEIYEPADKRVQKYYEFVLDSFNVDYSPDYNALDDALLESINDLIEKEISLSLMGRIRLIIDLIIGKKIYVSKY